MTSLNSQLGARLAPGWDAGLEIELARRHGCTRMVHMRHWGPLRVQRPFHPDGRGEGGSGECHLYLLHPPGGMVTGDRLAIDIALRDDAHGLLTTPSAGKIYRGNASAVPQVQTVNCRVGGDSYLEWLPQETIVFDGARGEIVTRVALEGGARCGIWDIVCLGRPASGERFTAGYLTQTLELTRAGRPLYRERNHFAGGSDLLAAPWGLGGGSVTGTFLLTLGLSREPLAALREYLAGLSGGEGGQVAISDLDGLLAIRYLGHSAEQCRRIFSAAWRRLRPAMCGREAIEPRIWRT
ncbi:MAG: urease accessory protein UreD [Porticoccaceae bacterium]